MIHWLGAVERIEGGVQTLTSTASLSTALVPHPRTRTQYFVSAVGLTVREACVPLATGFVVTPFSPSYHW